MQQYQGSSVGLEVQDGDSRKPCRVGWMNRCRVRSIRIVGKESSRPSVQRGNTVEKGAACRVRCQGTQDSSEKQAKDLYFFFFQV